MNRQTFTRSKAVAVEKAGARAAAVVLAIVAVKLLVLALDSNPRFFLWDSVTYLRGAVEGVLPRDRSFLYSLLIGAIAVPLHSLQALVVAQTLAGVGSAFLVYLILRKFLCVRFGFAALGALLVASEPAQLFYEHMVMAEAFGGLIWLGFITLVLAYVRDGRPIWLCAMAMAGIVSIAFRPNGTAVVLLVGPFLPLWRAWFVRSRVREDARPPLDRRRLIAHVAIAVASTLILHVGYRHVVAAVAHSPPGYVGVEGLYELGFVAIVVEDRDFAGTGCKPDILKDVERPLDDRRNYEYQLWSPGGLWAEMQLGCPDAEAAATVVAQRAFPRIPRHILPMAFGTVAQYFDAAETTWRMDSDLGRQGELPLELIEPAKKYFDLDVGPIVFTDTMTSLWFQHSRWWLTACFLLSPLLAALLVMTARKDASAALAKSLTLIVCGLFLSQFLLSPVIAFRYLHPFPPLMILCATAIVARYMTTNGFHD